MTGLSLAIQYKRAAYTETQSLAQGRQSVGNLPQGLMGREVASHQFLSALLRWGTWSRLDALLDTLSDRDPLTVQCTRWLHGSSQRRHVRIVPPDDVDSWLGSPTSEVLHYPYPPDGRIAEQRRRHAAHGFAISGVTHTLCSLPAIQTLWGYLASPFRSYDRLICTSQAVHAMVRDTVQAMSDRIAQTTGKNVTLPMGLEVCPLGVDLDLHKPASPRSRFEVRRRLGIPEDKLTLLFTGRLSHHAKAQPYPMFVAAQHVADKTRTEVCLILCGWFSCDVVRKAFEATARRVAPNVRLLIVDGLDPWWRSHAWDAADIFVSLADSIQETFGLTPLEAMARGIPVVASHWNGYRDIVEHGSTGYLVPTTMVPNSNGCLTDELIRGQINYDQFLARAGQTVCVSISQACESILSLADNPQLRQRLGTAGRARAERFFGWPTIIAAYESIWQTQRLELADMRKQNTTHSVPSSLSATYYPKLQQCFRSYPSRWIHTPETIYKKSLHLDAELASIQSDPLCNHSLNWSLHLPRLCNYLKELPDSTSAAQWIEQLAAASLEPEQATDAFAWLCKYGLLVAVQEVNATQSTEFNEPTITFVITCKGRLDDLKQTLPITRSQPGAKVIVVDYSCPQHSGDWVRQTFPSVRVVEVRGKSTFDRSDAKNAGGFAVRTNWMCLLDADIVLSPDFVTKVMPLLRSKAIVRSDQVLEGTGGTFLCEKEAFDRVGGHDPVFHGWGEQDEDLVDALRFDGGSLVHYPANLITHLHHDDTKRTQFHDQKDRKVSHTVNRIYRSMKWDWSKVAGLVPPIEQRQLLHRQIADQVSRVAVHAEDGTIEVDLGKLAWNPLRLPCRRVLQYHLGDR